MAMQYRQLGKTDLQVSRICFGCWQLSPRFWGDVPLERWEAALDRALELGVNFIDTADAYGDGAAEEALGAYMARRRNRDRLVLATKFYWNFEQEQRHPDTRHDYIIRACEASLKRLGTDRIDLYQVHAWDPLTRPEEVAAAFGRLRQAGKVRWFGVSNLNADQVRMYRRCWDVACLQPEYNMLERGPEAHELPLCLEERIGVISYSSLARGLLTGKYPAGHRFGDHRDQLPLFRGRNLETIMNGVARLTPLADKHRLSLAGLAVRWVLTHPAVTSAIIGVKKPEHIDTTVPAADAVLPVDDWHRAAGLLAETLRALRGEAA